MAKIDTQYDMSLMKQVREYAEHLRSIHATRNGMLDEMEKIFLMQWNDETKVRRAMENVKITRSPDARNKVLGAIRLLIAADPAFNLPPERNSDDTMDKADILEKWAAQVWWEAGRVRKKPVHYDSVLSMILFGEVHTPITRTVDMVEFAKGGTKAAQVRAEEIAACTPYLFDVWDPRTGYPDIGELGLTAYYREVLVRNAKILDEFGERGRKVLAEAAEHRYNNSTLCTFWDYEYQMVWVKGKDEPLVQQEHGLRFIPIDVQLGEGSMLFDEPENQRQPFLYSIYKSGLQDRQSLLLTVLYTMIFSIGANAMYVYQRNTPDKHLRVDWSRPGGIAEIEANESFGPLIKQVIDPSILTGMQIADDKSMESTIYGQTLGEPLGGNAPFSSVALLHQAGRLPLIVPQRLGGWGIADAVKKALLWYRNDPPKGSYYNTALNQLKATDIPQYFELEANLDLALPQDVMQQAQAAGALAGGERPLVSHEYALEKFLRVGQPSEMKRSIWREQMEDFLMQQYIQMAMVQGQPQQPQQVPPFAPEQGQSPNGGPPPVSPLDMARAQGATPDQLAVMQRMMQAGISPMPPPPTMPPEGM